MQATRPGDDHAKAPQGQTRGQRFAQVRKVGGDALHPLVQFSVARHAFLGIKGLAVIPSNVPKQLGSSPLSFSLQKPTLVRGGLTGHHRGMNRATNPYAGYRYPAEIIS